MMVPHILALPIRQLCVEQGCLHTQCQASAVAGGGSPRAGMCRRHWMNLDACAQVAGKQMVGLYLSVWVSRSMLPNIRGVQVTSVGTGVMGYLGNKGQSAARLNVQKPTLLVSLQRLRYRKVAVSCGGLLRHFLPLLSLLLSQSHYCPRLYA